MFIYKLLCNILLQQHEHTETVFMGPGGEETVQKNIEEFGDIVNMQENTESKLTYGNRHQTYNNDDKIPYYFVAGFSK